MLGGEGGAGGGGSPRAAVHAYTVSRDLAMDTSR